MRSWQFVLVILLAVCASVACDKSGEIESSQPAGSAIGPTIANLVSTTKQLSKASGGILRLSCDWSSPWIISTGTAYLIFVRSIQDTQASPTGVIGSGTASQTNPAGGIDPSKYHDTGRLHDKCNYYNGLANVYSFRFTRLFRTLQGSTLDPSWNRNRSKRRCFQRRDSISYRRHF